MQGHLIAPHNDMFIGFIGQGGGGWIDWNLITQLQGYVFSRGTNTIAHYLELGNIFEKDGAGFVPWKDHLAKGDTTTYVHFEFIADDQNGESTIYWRFDYRNRGNGEYRVNEGYAHFGSNKLKDMTGLGIKLFSATGNGLATARMRIQYWT
jgi:hypothetical protein